MKIKKNKFLFYLLVCGLVSWGLLKAYREFQMKSQMQASQNLAQSNPYQNFENIFSCDCELSVVTPFLKVIKEITEVSQSNLTYQKWLLMTENQQSIELVTSLNDCGRLQLNQYDLIRVSGQMSRFDSVVKLFLNRTLPITSPSKNWIELQGKKICSL